MRDRRGLVAAAVVLAVVLAGCAGAPAAPASTPVVLPSGVVASQVFPPPELARNTQGVDACSLLSVEQVRQFGLDPARTEPFPPGLLPGCFWRAADFVSGISVTIDSTTGLDNLYRGHALSSLALFEPLVVDGYPAVRAQQSLGSNDCTIYVGLAETQVMWVTGGANTSKRTDTCPFAKRAISVMLSNLPPLR